MVPCWNGGQRKLRLGIMLSHAGKEAKDVYKMLEWTVDGVGDISKILLFT